MKKKKTEKKSVKVVKRIIKKISEPQKKISASAPVKKIQPEPASLIITSPIHQVECLRCNAVTPIQKVAHNPTARFACIQCNAQLDVFNNCKTCNE